MGQKNCREIKLNDFYQAVILKSFGFELKRLERAEESFVTFVFDDPNLKAEETIKKYWNRELTVDPRTMVETINELKTRLHSGY